MDEYEKLVNEKAKLELEIKQLAVEKKKLVDEVVEWNHLNAKVIQDVKDEQARFVDLNKRCDALENEIRDIDAKVAREIADAEVNTEQARILFEEAKKEKAVIDAEKASLKEKISVFNEQVRTTEVNDFDYQKAMNELAEKSVVLDVEKEKILKERKEASVLKAELESAIAKNKELEEELSQQIKDFELKKSNYEDQKNRIAEEWAEIEKQKKQLAKAIK